MSENNQQIFHDENDSQISFQYETDKPDGKTFHYEERKASNADMYTLEAELVQKSIRKLADGDYADPMAKLRLLCLSRGASGILRLGKAFKEIHYFQGEILDPELFFNGIRETGLELSDEDILTIFKSMENEKGYISMKGFLDKLRPPIPEWLMCIVDMAFHKLDTNRDGLITVSELVNGYSVTKHPKYLNGELTKNEIITKLLHNFEGEECRLDDKITKDEFTDYYATIRATMDNDIAFDLLLRRSYAL